MSFSDTPNRLEAVFIQRDETNVRYDQINISGSNLIIFTNSTGSIDADKIPVWCDKYNIAHGTSSAPSNTGSVVAWGQININGTIYKIPLYL